MHIEDLLEALYPVAIKLRRKGYTWPDVVMKLREAGFTLPTALNYRQLLIKKARGKDEPLIEELFSLRRFGSVDDATYKRLELDIPARIPDYVREQEKKAKAERKKNMDTAARSYMETYVNFYTYSDMLIRFHDLADAVYHWLSSGLLTKVQGGFVVAEAGYTTFRTVGGNNIKRGACYSLTELLYAQPVVNKFAEAAEVRRNKAAAKRKQVMLAQ